MQIGMLAWKLTMLTPECPEGRQVIVIANDITHMIGSFGPLEDQLFKVNVQTLNFEVWRRFCWRRILVLYFSLFPSISIILFSNINSAITAIPKHSFCVTFYILFFSPSKHQLSVVSLASHVCTSQQTAVPG